MRHHVPAANRATEERQDAPLLERRREQASRRRAGGAEARSVFGRDQLVAGGGVAHGGRGVRYRRRRPPDAGLVPRGSWRGGVGDDASVVRLRLSEMRLHRPRQWGACWLAGLLWRELQLDRFWAERLPASRKRTRWDHVLQVGSDFGLAEAHKLYACHDLLLAHKDALFSHLTERWRDLFNAKITVAALAQITPR